MKKTLLIYLLLILPALFLFSCSEESSELEALESNTIHQPGVLDSASANFHGKFFVQKNMKFTDCQKCHGKNLDGGITNAKACSVCHPLATIHINLTGVQDSTSNNFHGRYLLQHSLRDCGQCHGSTFSGGSSSPSCVQCHKAITVHQPDFSDSLITSPNFHGKYPLNNSFGECQTCHGQNFAGKISNQNCTGCHQSIDVHQTGIIVESSPNFHGKYKLKNGLADCSSCHGTLFTGGSQSPSCITCHSTIDVHQSGINDQNSPNFHGKRNELKTSFAECQSCHGDNFQGGVNSTSCANCHSTITVHKAGIKDINSSDFHGRFLKANGWNISACASCHSSSFSGGAVSPTCKSSGCHTNPEGPAACNTCHGDFNNPSQVSPPKDLNGNTSSSYPGVGAHTKHLSAYANGISFACSECHTVPSDVNASGHLGSDGKAELNFGAFANKSNGSFYNFTTNECGNTYCHGNFEFKKSDASSSTAQLQYTSDRMVGNNRSPVWTNSDGSETKCSSCHGKSDADPSPIGHVSYTIDQCVYCHSSVVDASGTIIDKTKHINGKINVFGTKFRK